MRAIILGIFEQYGYKVISVQDEMFVLKHRDHYDYWIIKDYYKDLLEAQSVIKDSLLSEISYDEKIEKNMSMLVLMEEKEVSEELKQEIIDIEADQDFFKKYVILYTPKDLSELNEIVEWSQFADLLMDRDIFEQLKSETPNKNEIGPFHLAYSIAHKLPFIMTNVSHKSSEGLVNHFIPQNKVQQELFDWALAVDPESIEKEIIKEASKMK